jgi:hypothetical protein
MLGGFAYIMNRFLKISGYEFAKDFVFCFNGLSTEDKNFEADLKKKKAETYMLVDEIRAESDLPPLPDDTGKVVLNSVWQQNKQAAEMAAQQEEMGAEGEGEEGFEGFSDDETDAMAEEAMAGMEKAVKLI